MNYNHSEFEGRAEYSGFDPVDDATGSNEKGFDCSSDGHGTHVASLAAGRVYGVAKRARIFSVRVLECDGNVRSSIVISGINYAVQKANETGQPSVISMSLSTSYSESVNMATKNAILGGVPVVVSAGDDNDDACDYSPANVSQAITVGSSTIENQPSSFTNGGSCVDIFAPGTDIKGASSICTTCYQYLNGTSMATPLVSGVVAIILEWRPKMTPSQVKDFILRHAVLDSLDFSTFDFAETPNKLLHIPAGKLHYISVDIQYGCINAKLHSTPIIMAIPTIAKYTNNYGNSYYRRVGRPYNENLCIVYHAF